MSITNISDKNKLKASLFKPATKDQDPIRYQAEENQWGHILNKNTLGVGTDPNNLGIDGKTELIANMFEQVEGHVESEVVRLDGRISNEVPALERKLLGGASSQYNTFYKLEGHIKSNDSDITDLYDIKVDKSSVSDSTTNVSHVLVSSSYATKTTMDRANSAYSLANKKVSRSGDVWSGVHNLTSAQLTWSRDSDYAKIYMKDEGADAKRLAISFGDDKGTDGLILEWEGVERLVTFHQNKTEFEKPIFEQGVSLSSKYALANGTSSRDFNMNQANVYGDIFFKDKGTQHGSIKNVDGSFIQDSLVIGRFHEFRHQGISKLQISANDTKILNDLVVSGEATFSNNIELRSNGSNPYIDFSNNAVDDHDVRIALVDDNSLDIQGVSLDRFKVRGHRVLTDERMGHGSLIDADKIDGVEGSQIVRNDTNNIMVGNQSIDGTIIIRDEVIMKSITDKNNTQLGEFTYAHNDNVVDGVSHASSFSLQHKSSSLANGANESVVVAKGFSGNVLFEDGKRLSNKYLGLHAKSDDSNLLDGRDSTQYEQIDSVSRSVPTAGWYTIARGSGRCSAKFNINDSTSGMHGRATFYASISYGGGASITVLDSGGYRSSNGAFDSIRIKSDSKDGVYGSVEIQVYVERAANMTAYIMEDRSGHQNWSLVNYDPENVLLDITETAVELDFNTGILTSGTIYSNRNKRVYDTSTPPVKAEVGLGNVPNYSATSSLTDGSTSKFATAKAIKDLEDKKVDNTTYNLEVSKIWTDLSKKILKSDIYSDETNKTLALHSEVYSALMGKMLHDRVTTNEADIVWVKNFLTSVDADATMDSLQELLNFINVNKGALDAAIHQIGIISDGNGNVKNLGGFTPNQWMRSDVDDIMSGKLSIKKAGLVFDIGNSDATLSNSDAWFRMGNDTLAFNHVYKGSEGGNENAYELWTTNSKSGDAYNANLSGRVWRITQDGVTNFYKPTMFDDDLTIGVNSLKFKNKNLKVSESSVGNNIKIENTNGYVEIGRGNTSWAHFNTNSTLGFYFDKDIDALDLKVRGDTVYHTGRKPNKIDVGLSNLPNAKSDSVVLNDSNTLASSKAIKSVQDYANANRSKISSNDVEIAAINKDIGIGTYTHDSFVKKGEDSIITADIKTTGNILADKLVAGDGNALTVPFPKGAKLMTPGASSGAIKVKLPVSWNDTILRMTVNLFLDDPTKNATITLGGFLSTVSSRWINPFAQTSASGKLGDYRISFGHDGVNACIIIADPTHSWQGLQTNVVSLEAGYMSPGDTNITRYTWDDNWAITLIPNIVGITVSEVLNDNLTASDWNKIDNLPNWMTTNSDKAENSNKLDGIDSSQFLRSDIADEKVGSLTFTGNGNSIRYKDNLGNARDIIKFHDGDANGCAVSINGGGRTVISSGEAAHNMLNNIATAGSEIMGVAGDNKIAFHSNLQGGWGSRRSFEMDTDGSFKVFHGEIYAQDGTKKVYHQGFQGSGSGLDSDKIDGKHLSQLIQTDVSTQTIDGGINTSLIIKSDDTGKSEIALYGDSQGTGRVYVGQGTTHGGGIEYNGDSNPSTTGAGSDYVALYRRRNSVDNWTARNHHASNNWEFRGDVKAPTVTIAGWTVDIVEE